LKRTTAAPPLSKKRGCNACTRCTTCRPWPEPSYHTSSAEPCLSVRPCAWYAARCAAASSHQSGAAGNLSAPLAHFSAAVLVAGIRANSQHQRITGSPCQEGKRAACPTEGDPPSRRAAVQVGGRVS